LNVPKDFELRSGHSCTPVPSGDKNGNIQGDKRIFTWDSIPGNAGVIFCPFEAVGGKVSGPTKTYIVTAHADFSFTAAAAAMTALQWGSFCCPGVDLTCAGDNQCCANEDGKNGFCIPKGSYCATSETTGSSILFGGEDYCKSKIASGYGECEYGEGQCRMFFGDCDEQQEYPPYVNTNIGPLKCTSTEVGDICCFDTIVPQCVDLFKEKHYAKFNKQWPNI
jgi:hypothetical protein